MTVKVLELTADVTNPRPDRRSKDWNKVPVLAKGRRFTFHEGHEYNYVLAADERYHSEPAHRDLGKLVIDNAIEVEPKTFAEFARVYGDDHDAHSIATTLFKIGRIKREDFEAVKDWWDQHGEEPVSD